MTRPADRIAALVVHARDVPAGVRHEFAREMEHRPMHGGLLLETCHRVELYTVAHEEPAREALADRMPAGGRRLVGAEAIHHAIAVAVGRDSVVIGEGQILHQLRRAIDAARAAGAFEPELDRLFGFALHAGRRARSWQPNAVRSLGDHALETVVAQVGDLHDRPVLVVGAGQMGRLAAAAAERVGARVTIASRSADRAAALAAQVGGDVAPLEGPGDIGRFAAVIVALSGPWPISRPGIDSLEGGHGVVVDLSVPAALPEPLALALADRLTTADELARHAEIGSPVSDALAHRFDQLIESTAADYLAWLDAGDRRAAARALAERADHEREAELAELWRRLPDLDPDARATIEGMSRHLTDRILRSPLERLGADVDGRHERAVRELWAL